MSPLLLCLVSLIRHCLSGCGAEDSTLNIEKKCGEPYKITVTYDSMDRDLLIYIPTIFCNENDFAAQITKKLDNFNTNTPFDPKTHQITIPMLFSIHCLGCSAQLEIGKWKSFAEDHTFILIAPEGIQNSWNADQCCGAALENSVDDIGFIQTIVNGAQTSFSQIFPFATVRNKNYDGYVWITGFSNGGFMSDKIAWISSINQFSKIVAAAPMAGYIYDNAKYIKNALKNGDKHNKVPIYFHHSKADSSVNPNGCCMDSKDGCCCNIAQHSLKCLSIYSEFENWLQWNHCNSDITFESIKSDKITVGTVHGSENRIPVSCAYATPEEHGCDAHTYLCMYDGVHHAQWASSAPQTTDIMIFFLKTLCLQQNGRFNEVMVSCECDSDSVFGGMNCISPKSALGMKVTETNVRNSDTTLDISPNLKSKIEENAGEIDGGKVGKMESKVENEVVLDKNENVKSEKWKEAVQNGKGRDLKRRKNKDLSMLGNAKDKFSDNTFELEDMDSDGISHKMPNGSIVLICSLLFASIGLFVMYKKKQAGYVYTKVQLEDDDNETANNALISNQ